MVIDVVISCASEQLEYVDALAKELKRLEVSFYFDKNEDAETWGKSLPSHFQEVFEKEVSTA